MINPPIRVWDDPHIYPIGLGYIAASLISQGHRVEVLDINGERWSKEEVKDKIKEKINGYDAVGIGGLITTYAYVKWLISIIKEAQSGIPVIVGDNGATFSYHIYLEKAGADVAVIGEGDITIQETIKTIERKADLNQVKGIAFMRNGNVVTTPPRERIQDLDRLPYPERDLFPVEKYIQYSLSRMGGMRFLVLSATRGCPFHCKFCYPAFGRQVTYRSARSIVDEIKYLKERYAIECIMFSDDLFIINRKRLFEFCDIVVDEKVNIKWYATARVDMVDKDMLKKIKGAGCVQLGFGLESANSHILADMKKGFTVERARKAIRLTKKMGIYCVGSWVIGWPNETPETVHNTIQFILTEDIPFGGIGYATPYPGCELFDDVKRSGKIRDEEGFIEKLGDAREFFINLTRMPDEQLINLREKVYDVFMLRYGPFTRKVLGMTPRHLRWFVKLIWLVRFWGFTPASRLVARHIASKLRDQR